MAYAKLNTNNEIEAYPYYPKDLFRDYPSYKTARFNMNSPRPANVVLVLGQTPSSYDPATQNLSYATTPTQIDGEWKLAVTVTDKTAEELARETSADEARAKRDKLLAETDAEMLKLLDNAASWSAFNTDRAAWNTYRQALRDVPSQDGFPTNITWPTKPE